jgi:hypothetical protein
LRHGERSEAIQKRHESMAWGAFFGPRPQDAPLSALDCFASLAMTESLTCFSNPLSR